MPVQELTFNVGERSQPAGIDQRTRVTDGKSNPTEGGAASGGLDRGNAGLKLGHGLHSASVEVVMLGKGTGSRRGPS